ncbi:hypothetical protein FRC03_003036, partial [Tulasnella sp. 419]
HETQWGLSEDFGPDIIAFCANFKHTVLESKYHLWEVLSAETQRQHRQVIYPRSFNSRQY